MRKERGEKEGHPYSGQEAGQPPASQTQRSSESKIYRRKAISLRQKVDQEKQVNLS